MDNAFDVESKNFFLAIVLKYFLLLFLKSYYFMFYIFKSMIHFELIFSIRCEV